MFPAAVVIDDFGDLFDERYMSWSFNRMLTLSRLPYTPRDRSVFLLGIPKELPGNIC